MQIGDKVIYAGSRAAHDYVDGEPNWLEPGTPGVVVKIHVAQPTVRIKGETFPGIGAWATVEYPGTLGPTRRGIDIDEEPEGN